MEKNQENTTGFHQFNESTSASAGKVVIFFVIIIVLAVGTGFILSKINKPAAQNVTVSASGKVSSTAKGTVVGSTDLSTFKDTATGVLQMGGIDGEGQYHLVRPGGDSQNVYLTSSIVDLSQFIGKTIKVNGQTQAAKHAGWLMDVGRVEVVQ
ncbi:MAG TPA: hypothetical protein VF820_03515 [Patescibacteria group bacterium]